MDALSFIVFSGSAYERGRKMCEKLKEEIPRQLLRSDPGGYRQQNHCRRDSEGNAQRCTGQVLRRDISRKKEAA